MNLNLILKGMTSNIAGWFLEKQLELLKARQSPENDIEWQDIADERAKYYGNIENRDTVRKGSKLLYEYLDAGWNLSKEVSNSNNTDIDDKIRELQKERHKSQATAIEDRKSVV